MKKAQLAINSISTRQASLEQALDAYAAAGFPNVEFHLPLVKEWLAVGHTVEEARRLLDERGLRAVGGFETHIACFAAREEQLANHQLLRDNARLIHSLGGGTMVVGTDGPEAMPSDPLAALDPIAGALRALAVDIAGEGLDVTIALEFNWSPIVRSLQSAVCVARKVDHPRVGALFDPAHYYVTPTKFEDLTAETVPWIAHVHLDDMRDVPGDLAHCNDDRALPGDGVLDLPALIARLEAYGYAGRYAIEMFSADLWALPAAEAARRCYQSLLPLCRD